MKKSRVSAPRWFLPWPFWGLAEVALGNRGTLATITGSVKDSKGNPLAGAVISLIKDGANQVSKQTRTGPDGRFSAKILPGRYGIRAIAQGFNEVVFDAVEVRASQELIYKFNLEPAGSGRTLPERRRDRDDVKWRLRAAQSQRSIFQAQEGADETIKAVNAAETAANERAAAEAEGNDAAAEREGSAKRTRTQGVIETYFAGNASDPGFVGMNFAVAMPASERVDLIFAGQAGTGASAPQRFEVTGLVRAGDRHRINLSAGGMRIGNALATNKKVDRAGDLGQFSVRAIDEWVVRDGVVIVLGLDYSRFHRRGRRSFIYPAHWCSVRR